MLSEQIKNDYMDLFSGDTTWIDIIKNKSILVTGATGLIGSNIIKALLYYNCHFNGNIKIYANVRNINKAKQIFCDYLNVKLLNFVVADISTSNIDIPKVDFIIHCASNTVSKDFVTKPVETIETLIYGTNNVLKLAKKNKVSAFIYVSSMESYGSINNETEFTNENDSGYINTMSVRSCYSEGKRLAECLCASYVSEYGLNIRVARLAQVFGAGVSKNDNRVFMQLAKSAINKTDFVMKSDGSSWGNYCYITDVIKALILLLTKGKSGEAYNIVNEKNSMTIKSMAELVRRDIAHNQFNIIYDIPKSELECGYAPKTVMKLSSKKMNSLGWEAKVRLVDMYKRMINYLIK